MLRPRRCCSRMEVKNRKHLADVMRRVRRTGVVSGVYRYPL